MVRHIVTFKLKGDADLRRRVAREFADALSELPSKIECLRSIETGVNENPGEEWDVALIATVDSMEDIEVYSRHPAHQACVKIIAPHKELRACVDFSV